MLYALIHVRVCAGKAKGIHFVVTSKVYLIKNSNLHAHGHASVALAN